MMKGNHQVSKNRKIDYYIYIYIEFNEEDLND